MRMRIERQAIGMRQRSDASSAILPIGCLSSSSDRAMFSATVSASNSEKCWKDHADAELAGRTGLAIAPAAFPDDLAAWSARARRTAS
jgi:hypothetical protein